jgi:hypothetical protein
MVYVTQIEEQIPPFRQASDGKRALRGTQFVTARFFVRFILFIYVCYMCSHVINCLGVYFGGICRIRC